MPNSNGKESEKAPNNKGEANKTAQKRKRNRNRKKNAAKVENLVSKTFQAKLVANSSQCENTQEDKDNVGFTDQKIPEQSVKGVPSNNNRIESSSTEILIKAQHHPKTLSLMGDTSILKNNNPEVPKSVSMVHPTAASATSTEKSRQAVLAEREAKKLAKQQAKKKNNAKPNPETIPTTNATPSENTTVNKIETNHLPNGDQIIHKESNEKGFTNKLKQETIQTTSSSALTAVITEKLTNVSITDTPKDATGKVRDKPVLTKAERRAIQEAQRAAKADTGAKKPSVKAINLTTEKKPQLPKEVATVRAEKLPLTKPIKDCKVKLFNHLESCRKDSNLFINNPHIHPIIVRLGEQYAKRTIVGSNARCISFLSALKSVIQDYETPAKKEFTRSLETTITNSVDHLHKCRPLAVSVCNAYKHIKHVLTQLPVDQPESELKERLCHFVDTYIENQIGKAAQAISISVQEKISNGDVILTFGCSSLINYIFEEAHRRHVDFRVIVVDSRPFSEGQELLRRLTAKEIPCTYVLINAVGFVMSEVTKILLGAHALLSNGYVMARTGTAQVALVARSFNVPVLVCCETHKFSERFQTDAIVYNELGNPDDLVMSDKCRLMNWQSQNKLSPLNLNYDITPPELVTAVVTEVGILPCTSVPVILRIKPTEIGY